MAVPTDEVRPQRAAEFSEHTQDLVFMLMEEVLETRAGATPRTPSLEALDAVQSQGAGTGAEPRQGTEGWSQEEGSGTDKKSVSQGAGGGEDPRAAM